MKKYLKTSILFLIILNAIILAACGSTSGEGTNETESNSSIDEDKKDSLEENVVSFEGVSVGDVVCFGSYEQDEDYTNGKEQIEWEVVDEQEGALLLVSKYILSLQSYNSTGEDTTWENSSLRSWLNEEFLNGAFSEEEQRYICTTTVATGTESAWVSVEGENTQDKIFVLSGGEVCSFWEDEDARRSGGTTAVGTGYGYWLRCNTISKSARYVNWLGESSKSGEVLDLPIKQESGVRPALWVSISTDNIVETTMGDISIRYTQVGDTVTFGSNSGTSQEWIVAKIEADKLMLVSKECLKKSGLYFKMSFDTSGGTWDVSSLREWLNGEYLTETFTDEEIAQILTTTVVTSGCADTEDKVFILSEEEAEDIFPTAEERATGVATGGNRKGWWLRDNHYVDENGHINNSVFGELSVRPVIWIQNEDFLIYINAYIY